MSCTSLSSSSSSSSTQLDFLTSGCRTAWRSPPRSRSSFRPVQSTRRVCPRPGWRSRSGGRAPGRADRQLSVLLPWLLGELADENTGGDDACGLANLASRALYPPRVTLNWVRVSVFRTGALSPPQAYTQRVGMYVFRCEPKPLKQRA